MIYKILFIIIVIVGISQSKLMAQDLTKILNDMQKSESEYLDSMLTKHIELAPDNLLRDILCKTGLLQNFLDRDTVVFVCESHNLNRDSYCLVLNSLKCMGAYLRFGSKPALKMEWYEDKAIYTDSVINYLKIGNVAKLETMQNGYYSGDGRVLLQYIIKKTDKWQIQTYIMNYNPLWEADLYKFN
ncbi:MAG: hypothetical protein LWX56_03635 [Ignavibacteria bacterium]|nr:hypothetical protein [Ignavibacteria bacterium]